MSSRLGILLYDIVKIVDPISDNRNWLMNDPFFYNNGSKNFFSIFFIETVTMTNDYIKIVFPKLIVFS